MAIRFYKIKDEYGCFSNFSPHGFVSDGKYWATSEHYYQAQKFLAPELQEEVRILPSPMNAALFGRDKANPVRDDWEEIKDNVMRVAVLEKFRTNADIRATLLSTGNQEIIEATTDDYYWGCGNDGTGLNMLGKILMEVRTVLEEQC